MIVLPLIAGVAIASVVALGYALLTDRSLYSLTYFGRLYRWIAWIMLPLAVLAWVGYAIELASGRKDPKSKNWAYGLTASFVGAWIGGAATGSVMVAMGTQRYVTPVEAAALAAAAAQKYGQEVTP